MQYKTRNGSSPQGKPRVYFCCHPKDHDRFFQPITDEILAKQNCAIWYGGDVQPEELSQMQLVVMPVTRNLLQTKNDILQRIFPYATEHHIPVLPLLQDSGLTESFNQACGDLHFLNKRADDVTAISYDEKLEKFLSSVLIGDELAETIRNAFTGQLFLSYRKKDRKHAQALMERIHSQAEFRRLAIWYDEFLIPGHNYNDAIAGALQRSELFLLAVTPNLICEPNYVQAVEYPMAQNAAKPVLAAELLPTDRAQLAAQYPALPAPVNAHDEAALFGALRAVLGERKEESTPLQTYLIGLAYLGGVDVEVNTALAVDAITKAAEAGLTEAVDRLYDMHLYGIGVPRDPQKALQLKLRYAKHCKKQFSKTGQAQFARGYITAVTDVCRWQVENKMLHRPRARLLSCYTHFHYRICPRLSETEAARLEYLLMDAVYRLRYAQGHYGAAEHICVQMLETLKHTQPADDPMTASLEVFRIRRRIARLQQRLRHYEYAEAFCLQNMEQVQNIASTLGLSEDFGGWLAVAYHDLADLYYAKGDPEQGDAYAARVLESLRNAHDGNGAMLEGSLHNLGISYSEMGSLKCERGDLSGALECYGESARVFRQLKESRYTAETVYHLAEALAAMGDLHRTSGSPQAAEHYREALALFTEAKDCHPEAHCIEITRLKLALLEKDIHTLQQLKSTFLSLHRTDPENQLFTDALELLDGQTET